MVKLTLETSDGSASVEILEDANIYTYANAFIKLLHYSTFTEGSISKIFGTTFFDDGEL